MVTQATNTVSEKTSPVDFDNAVQVFCDYLKIEKRFSPHTVSNYRRDLEAVAHELSRMKVADWSGANAFNMRTVISRQHGEGLSGRSLARRLSAVRSLFKHLIRHKHIEVNPVADVPAPKDQQKLPETLQIEDIQRLFAMSGDDVLLLRDRAVFELIYSCGLRLAEVVQLDVDSIDMQAGMVRVTGKGDKARDLPVGREALKAVQEWKLRRLELQRGNATEQALFISNRGARLSARSIQQRLKTLAQKTGISHNVYPHLLRHSFASHMLESSGDLRAVQELLGHADITTTQVYTHLDFQHLARVYEKAHPRASSKVPGKKSLNKSPLNKERSD